MIVDNLTGSDIAVIVSAIDVVIRAIGNDHDDTPALRQAKHKVLCAKSEEEPDYNPGHNGDPDQTGILSWTVLTPEGGVGAESTG